MANPSESARTTVFVSDLSRQIDAAQIRLIFQPYGDITDLTLNESSRPGQGLNAIISFHTHEQALTVIRECNYMKLNGVPIHVYWRDNDHQWDPRAKIVITNLPSTVEEAELHDALQEYGAVESVRITRRPNGESAGIAYVQFENVAGAQKAHDSLQGAAIKGQEIKVDSFRMPNERLELHRKLPPGFIAVEPPDGSSLPPPEILTQIFSQFGEISDIFPIQAYMIVNFINPEATTAAASLKDDRVIVLPALRWSVQQDLLREVERRKIYVCDLTDAGIPNLPVLLAKAGRVVQIANVSRPNDLSAIVQYDSPESRRRALDLLDGEIPAGQATPIHILPFFDKRLEHPPGGLLQLNELAPCTSRALRARYSAFGAVLAVAIAPTASFLVGFVLFERFEDAQRAHEDASSVNTFLYPPVEDLQVRDIASSFADKMRGRWLAVYGAQGFVQGFAADIAWGAPVGDTFAAFLLFRSREELVGAIARVRESGRRFDLLSSYLLLKTAQLLTQATRPVAPGRLLFVAGLAREVGNRQLREMFQGIGRVEAAMVTVSVEAGVPVGHGVVLFAEVEHALVAKQTPPIVGEFGGQLVVTDFRGKVERTAAGVGVGGVPEPQQIQVLGVGSVIPHARDQLRAMIRQRQAIAPEKMARMVNAVAGLCLDDVYTLVQVPQRLDAWIQRQIIG